MHVPDRIALSHLDRMTDSTGLVQHAIYSVPRRQSGYTTDDNARALRLCAALWDLCPDERMLQRASTYLGFLEFARGIGGKFHNFLSYDRHWLDAEGSDDCQGQAVRALAEVVASGLPAGFRTLARDLLETAAPKLSELRSPRALAYIVLAWGRMGERRGRAYRRVGSRGLRRERGGWRNATAIPCGRTGSGSSLI